jgi:RNA polymerase-binding transcription factor
MTDERYTRLKQMLVDHRRRLQRSLSVRLNEVRAHNHDDKVVEALDAAEASASDLEQDFGIALAEMAAQALRHVDQALARLESGGYGSCVDCNEKISHERLTALPFALRCRVCEELREVGERRPPRLSAESGNSLHRYAADV